MRPTSKMIHNCHFCNGEREHDGKVCLGCGSPVHSCAPRNTKPRSKNCPACRNPGPHQMISFERYRCRGCSVIMEKQDFCFVDDRPELNAIKKEEAAAELKRRQRKKGVSHYR